jgi:hypothetical protein
MFGVGIGIGVARNRVSGGVTPPSGFATTQWQLLTVTNWNNITETWT